MRHSATGSTFVGHRPDAVIDLMFDRRRRGTSPLAGSDGRKLALIVEGGGMRGTLSAGALLALDVLGFRPVFDEVYATSAGAVNAAYFLSGQGAYGITIYFDDISNRRFINPWRFWRMVDIGFVYDEVVSTVKPLDEQALRTQPAALFFSVTDMATGENHLLDVKAQPEPVTRMLKATSALPILYNRTIEVGGRTYIDGGASCTLPIVQAAERGCTDVLVVMTKRPDHRSEPPTWWRKSVLYWALGRTWPKIMDAYSVLDARNRNDRELAAGIHKLETVNVATIFPTAEELVVERTTIDREKLVLGAERMAVRTAELLGDDAARVREAFEEFKPDRRRAKLHPG
jgi:predicted patatin/cPLA2 family phospholipase